MNMWFRIPASSGKGVQPIVQGDLARGCAEFPMGLGIIFYALYMYKPAYHSPPPPGGDEVRKKKASGAAVRCGYYYGKILQWALAPQRQKALSKAGGEF